MGKMPLNVVAVVVLGLIAAAAPAQLAGVIGLGDKPDPAGAPAAEEKEKPAGDKLFDRLGRMIDSSKTLVRSRDQRGGVHTLRVGHKGKWRLHVAPSVNEKWVWIEFPCMKADPARLRDAKWLADLSTASMNNGVASFTIDPKTDFLSLKLAVPVKGLEAADLEDLIDQVVDKADQYRRLWDFPETTEK